MKKLILSLSMIVITLVGITGCNTISGMGRDVSTVGSDVAAGANAVGRSMSNH
ncbi:MAG: entericidin A/B family lipoprotein [Verrucomicrobia bacterium]|jgi:predicted small secreted protein|nr:MAG: entericidin A/B family lipoprotein [Verrucomicrobiota bacterium]MDH4469837.1 entericidin [Verrucomicrobiae bacterium]